MDINEICLNLRRLLEESVKRNPAEGILLSGGLDTSIIATIASKYGKPKAFTIAFKEAPSPDIKYAKHIAKKLKLEHTIHTFNMDELYAELPTIIRVTKTFDPMEIRNSIVILIGLKTAKEAEVNTVLTGDGADELLAGYSFLFKYPKKELELELQKMWKNMHFSSKDIAAYLNMEAKLPYLDEDFQSFAKQIDAELKVHKENNSVIGKWILRKAYEDTLPKNIVWRVKTPIEQGSGTAHLPKIFDTLISDEEFNQKRKKILQEDHVEIRDKEHLTYYEVYRSEIGVPSATNTEGKTCPKCNSKIPTDATYCRICGAYPIQEDQARRK